MIIHNEKVREAGTALSEAEKLLVMLHGRGDSAAAFIRLAERFDLDGRPIAVHAIQAVQNTWYPYGFMEPREMNEPQLTNSLDAIAELLHNVAELNIDPSQVYFVGFSQGACLALEYVARNPRRYGGVIAFTGGLIGQRIETERYRGDFEGTPIFIGASSQDPHVPEKRMRLSRNVLEAMGASVTLKIYDGLGHTINENEIDHAKLILMDNGTNR